MIRNKIKKPFLKLKIEFPIKMLGSRRELDMIHCRLESTIRRLNGRTLMNTR